MKKSVFLGLIISLVIGSCTQEKNSPIEGTWQLVFSQAIAGDTISEILPGDYTGSQVKTWTKNYVIWVGHYTRLIDTVTIDNYGGGTYKLEGDKFEEMVQYHLYKSNVGTTKRMLLEIRNDTLIQTWPADNDWKINKSSYNVEKYVRLK
jgi:hypothetical protein